MTPRDLISSALRLIGALAPGESLAAGEASDGLSSLNRLVSSWSNDSLLIHATTQESPITLTPGDSTVTLGTAGDLANRPMTIVSAIIRDGSTDYPLRKLTDPEFAAISDKSTQSTLPREFHEDGGYPLRTITLYPTPAAAKSLILYTQRALSSFASLDATVSLPPGYEDAIVYNLAVRFAPEYGRVLDQRVDQIANETLAAIKRKNHKPRLLQVDAALMSRGGFNITTGDFG